MVLAAGLALALMPVPFALAAGKQPIEISQHGDLEKSCAEISKEVAAMDTAIRGARDVQDNAQVTSTGVGVAKTVGSYLVGTLAGGIGILAAGYLVNEATDDRAENALALQDAAEKRRSFMAGIFNARGCTGPLMLSEIEPAGGEEDAPLPVRSPRGYNN